MVYRRSKTNIRKPRRSVRRRRSTTRRTRRRRAIPRGQAKPCKCPGELSPSAKFALAQLDPFEPKCLGAKIPDSNTMPSIANSDCDQVTMTQGGTSNWLTAFAFLPSYTQAFGTATPVDPSTVSWTATFQPRRNQSSVVAAIEGIRPVAHAIRLSSPLAPTTSTGFVHIGLAVESRINSGSGAVPDWPKTVNEMTGLAHYQRFTLASLTQSPITVINKWIDETGFRYDDPRAVNVFAGNGTAPSTVSLNFLQSWGTIIVMAEGQAANTAFLSAEHLLLTEALPRKDAFILGTTAAPNSPGTMSSVSQMLAETPVAHTEAEQETYISQGLAALERGAAVAGEQVWNNIALPLLERVGHGAGAYASSYAMSALLGTGGIPGVNNNANRLAIRAMAP